LAAKDFNKMKKIVVIMLLAVSATGCQKDISCEDWEMCPNKPVKCIEGKTWMMPAGNIDVDSHLVFTPLNNAYHIYAHADFAKTWGSCLPINVPDSAGWYRVVSKDIYLYNGNESPYVQIGGTDMGWYGHETSTYFFIMQKEEWDTITRLFKPNL
jgi:hypothetical protein